MLVLKENNFYFLYKNSMIWFPKLLLLWTAVFFLLFLIPAILVPKKFIKAISGVIKNEEIIRVWSFAALLFWLLYLWVYRKLDGTLPMVFAIFWRLSLVKGIVLFWYPSLVSKKAKYLYNSVMWVRTMWILILFMSAFLVWLSLKM